MNVKALAKRPELQRVRMAMLPPLRATYGRGRPMVPVREELPFLLNRRRLVGDGAEIGVKTGWFSEVLLDRWNGRRLISIDPWEADEPDAYVDVANVAQEQHEAFLAETRARLARFGERSEIWRDYSTTAAERVADGSLDFVYLDARHDRDSVLEALEAWFGKVRPGGVIAGHDYVDGTFPEGDFGVKSAVDAFFGERGLHVMSTWGDPPWLSWFVLLRQR